MALSLHHAELERWLHNHVVRLLERAGENNLTEEDRRACMDLAAQLRHEFLGDNRAHLTSVQEAVDKLRLYAAELELHLSVFDAVGPVSPPSDVVGTIFVAAETLVGNVAKHAGVREATVTVNATPVELIVSIADRGSGFDPNLVTWSPTTQRLVVDAVAAIGGEARLDHTSPGAGTRWILRWKGEPT